MIGRKRFSYDGEREYYRHGWPVDARPYQNLDPYFSSWLGDRASEYFNGKTVLDVGAGEATYTRFIAEHFRPQLVVALDLFHQRLVPAHRSFYGANFSSVCGDCFALPFPDGTFDTVFGSLVLHQVGDLGPVATEISRVLKPGGIFVGFEPNFLNPVILFRFLFGRHSPNQYLFGRRHLQVFERCGFDVGFRYFYWKWPGFRVSVAGTCIGLVLTKKNIVVSPEATPRLLSIVIPGGKRSNLIYRVELDRPIEAWPPSVGRVLAANSILDSWKIVKAWLGTFGFKECARLVAKLFLGKRHVIAVVVGNEIASYAWLYGVHPYDFPVDKEDSSIALVSTSTFYRGLGLAEILLRELLNLAGKSGYKACFIETASDNERMIRVIEKCGCWTLVGSYLRLGPRYP